MVGCRYRRGKPRAVEGIETELRHFCAGLPPTESAVTPLPRHDAPPAIRQRPRHQRQHLHAALHPPRTRRRPRRSGRAPLRSAPRSAGGLPHLATGGDPVTRWPGGGGRGDHAPSSRLARSCGGQSLRGGAASPGGSTGGRTSRRSRAALMALFGSASTCGLSVTRRPRKRCQPPNLGMMGNERRVHCPDLVAGTFSLSPTRDRGARQQHHGKLTRAVAVEAALR